MTLSLAQARTIIDAALDADHAQALAVVVLDLSLIHI